MDLLLPNFISHHLVGLPALHDLSRVNNCEFCVVLDSSVLPWKWKWLLSVASDCNQESITCIKCPKSWVSSFSWAYSITRPHISPVKCVDIPFHVLQEILCDPPSVFSFPQKVVTRASGGGCLLEFPTVYKAFSGNVLVFWMVGPLWEVVAHERWSHKEFWLYYYLNRVHT